MRQILVTTVSALALTMTATGTFAACNIGQETGYTKEDRAVNSAAVRQDLRQLRQAAMILRDRNQDQACSEVVQSITEIRQDANTDAAVMRKGGSVKVMKDRSADTMKNADNTQPAAGRATSRSETWQQRAKERVANAVPLSEAKGRLSASNLIGADIVGQNNDTIAEIEDVVMTPDGKASYVVVGFGGFLGLGEDQSAIPFDHLRVAYDQEDNEPTFFLKMTEDDLAKAPRFKRGSIDWVSDENWRTKNDAYYNDAAKS